MLAGMHLGLCELGVMCIGEGSLWYLPGSNVHVVIVAWISSSYGSGSRHDCHDQLIEDTSSESKRLRSRNVTAERTRESEESEFLCTYVFFLSNR